MNILNKFSLIILCVVLIPDVVCGQSDEKKHNILFISVDDFRPKINSYGESKMITPNIDKLAKEGIQFKITQLVMKDDKALEGRHKENPKG